MNNKGFTLIELIMVIAILAMLALLVTPNVIKIIEKNKVDNYNSTIDSIIKATDLYVSNNRYDLTFKNEYGNPDNCMPGDTKIISTSVTLGDLVDSENLKSTVKDSSNNDTVENACNKIPISRTTKITINLSCKTRQFSYHIDFDTTNSTLIKDSNITEENGKIKKEKTCNELY